MPESIRILFRSSFFAVACCLWPIAFQGTETRLAHGETVGIPVPKIKMTEALRSLKCFARVVLVVTPFAPAWGPFLRNASAADVMIS